MQNKSRKWNQIAYILICMFLHTHVYYYLGPGLQSLEPYSPHPLLYFYKPWLENTSRKIFVMGLYSPMQCVWLCKVLWDTEIYLGRGSSWTSYMFERIRGRKKNNWKRKKDLLPAAYWLHCWIQGTCGYWALEND